MAVNYRTMLVKQQEYGYKLQDYTVNYGIKAVNYRTTCMSPNYLIKYCIAVKLQEYGCKLQD